MGRAVVTAAALLAAGCAQEAADDSRVFRGETPPMPAQAEVLDVFDDIADTADDIAAADLTLHLELEISSGLQGQTSTVDFDGAFDAERHADVEVTTGVPLSATDLHMISDGETVWVQTKVPEVVDELPEGVTWIEAPYDDLLDAGIVTDFATTWQMLPFLRGAETAEDGGVTLAHGQLVRVIRGTIDDDKAHDKASFAEESGLDVTFTFTEPIDRFAYEVWLDDQGRVWRIELEPEATARGGSMRGRLELEVRSFDQAVVIDPPPSDEVVPVDQLPGGVEILQG
jgi:hypothetical protein